MGKAQEDKARRQQEKDVAKITRQAFMVPAKVVNNSIITPLNNGARIAFTELSPDKETYGKAIAVFMSWGDVYALLRLLELYTPEQIKQQMGPNYPAMKDYSAQAQQPSAPPPPPQPRPGSPEIMPPQEIRPVTQEEIQRMIDNGELEEIPMPPPGEPQE